MMRLLRVVTLLLAAALVPVLAIAAGVVAVFSIQGGRGGLSLTHLSRLIGLPSLRHSTGHLLSALAAPGTVAIVTLLVAVGAMILALLVLIGLIVPARELRVVLEDSEGAVVAARRRPLLAIARDLALESDGVTEAKVRVRPGRRHGGRLNVRVWRVLPAARDAVRGSVDEHLSTLTGPFPLRARVSVRDPRPGRRVQ